MTRICLIHWKEEEWPERVERLEALGYQVEPLRLDGTPSLKRIRQTPPDLFVIDLARMPSHGREIGTAVRQSKSTRHVPLVYVGGLPEKVKRVRQLLPDATYADWPGVGAAITRALRTRPRSPVVPESLSGTPGGAPLIKKLGIREGATVALIDAPEGWEDTLGDLPANVKLRHDLRGKSDITLWFVRDQQSLLNKLDRLYPRAERGGLWIAWPKKTSELAGDLSQNLLRQHCLAQGLVDYKISKLDDDWAALKFSHKRR